MNKTNLLKSILKIPITKTNILQEDNVKCHENYNVHVNKNLLKQEHEDLTNLLKAILKIH